MPHHVSTGRTAQPHWCSASSLGTTLAMWEPQLGRAGRATCASSATTIAGTAARRCPPARTRSPTSAATCSRSLDGSGRRSRSAGSRSAAWSACGSRSEAPERVERLVLCCTAPTSPPAEQWHDRAALVRAEGTRRDRRRGARPLVHACRRRAPRRRALPRDARRDTDRGLRRLLRGDRRHRPARAARAHPAPDARGRRARRPGRAARRAASARRRAFPAPGSSRCRRRAPRRTSSSPTSSPSLLEHLRRRPMSDAARARHARCAARCWATSTSTGRPGARPTFTADFQDFITRYAWGEIWARPGLDRRTRSCITLDCARRAGREDELAMHVRARAAQRADAGRDQGGPPADRRSTAACPAANRAFAIAQRVLDEDALTGVVTRTQVGIVGAGPAGLDARPAPPPHGIESVVLEDRSRDYVERRLRAGVLEQGTVDLLRERRRGGPPGRRGDRARRHRPPVRRRTAPRRRCASSRGRAITIYGQTEVVKDLIAARLEAGLPLLFEVEDVTVHDARHASGRASATGTRAPTHELECDAIAGCDGFHGVCRPAIPARCAARVLARVPVRVAGHPRRGRAVDRRARSTPTTSAASPCSPAVADAQSRYYVQVRARRGRRRTGPTSGSGRSSSARLGARRLDAARRARSSRRASPGCGASSSSRCSTAGCSSPATRRTSCRRPAPRG